jgi:hypothetical protein
MLIAMAGREILTTVDSRTEVIVTTLRTQVSDVMLPSYTTIR